MTPYLCPGDYVIASRYFVTLHIGDVVIVKHAQYGDIIKRIVAVCDMSIELASDSDKGLRREQMGVISKQAIHSKVIFTIKT